jgi:hypothetical protein
MSENKERQEPFDLWLTSNLKANHPINPKFTQKLVHDIEQIIALQLLNRIAFQEKIAKIVICLTLTAGIGLLCCVPLLKKVYLLLEEGFLGLMRCFIHPPQLNLGMIALVLFVFILLSKAIWDKIAAEI